MRWRFVDRVTRFDPWTTIDGRKGISLEEFSLLKPFGRKGALPETLLVESCVHLARWLVVASSNFRESALLSSVDSFAFERGTRPGETLDLRVDLGMVQPDEIRFECEIAVEGHWLARGILGLRRHSLGELGAAEDARTLWRELYGKA